MDWSTSAGDGVVVPAVRTYPPESRSVIEARRGAREALSAWHADELQWTASQLISELTTNAVLHAGTTFEVSLRLEGARLRCEVTDGSPYPPRVRHYSTEATTGRGMRLVERLSSAWGVDPRPSGKTVWFELDVTAGGTGREPDLEDLLDAFDIGDPVAGWAPDPRPNGTGREARGFREARDLRRTA